MKRFLLTLVIAGVAFATFHQNPAHWRGIPAPKDPQQTAENLPPAFRRGTDTITPLARYVITAVVLSRSHYRFDRGATIAPIDLALGWGPMSVAGVINELNISQSGRFYEYSWPKEPPLEPALIINHSANTHCLPADKNIRRQLLAVKRHQLVSLEGFLVRVDSADGGHWQSSLTREDSGGGACEVMWITAVTSHNL